MPKEVRQYHESIFFGLSLRQFGCSLAAVGAAVGLYFGCVDTLGTEATGWVCILGAAPLALAGFFTYNGMPLEKFLWAVYGIFPAMHIPICVSYKIVLLSAEQKEMDYMKKSISYFKGMLDDFI